MNNETFGNATDLGTDFDFGYGKGELSSNSAPSAAQVDHGRSYASAATTGPVVTNPGYVAAAPHSMDEGMDFTPMESLWTNQPMMMQHPQQPQHPQVLSMEELERQQQQQQIGVPHGQQQGYMGMPPMPPMGYGYAPQAFMPQAQVMPGAAYPSAPQGMPPQGLPLPPQGMPPQSMPPRVWCHPSTSSMLWLCSSSQAPTNRLPSRYLLLLALLPNKSYSSLPT